MGYQTSFTGEIAIDPPVPWSMIKGSRWRDRGQDRIYNDAMLRVVKEQVETPDGTLVRKHADAIIPAWEDEMKGYHFVEHVQAIVDEIGGGRTFSGYISAEGEEAGDLWRVYVRNGQAVRVEPAIVWPDEP